MNKSATRACTRATCGLIHCATCNVGHVLARRRVVLYLSSIYLSPFLRVLCPLFFHEFLSFFYISLSLSFSLPLVGSRKNWAIRFPRKRESIDNNDGNGIRVERERQTETERNNARSSEETRPAQLAATRFSCFAVARTYRIAQLIIAANGQKY